MAVTGTLSRYIARRYLGELAVVFLGMFLLVSLVDFVEMMRRAGNAQDVSVLTVAQISLFRIPQLMERVLPFTVLISTMSCYLNLSRRLELVVARSAGLSVWQIIAPAVIATFAIGIIATTLYNPVSATLQEQSKKLEVDAFGMRKAVQRRSGGTFWLNQRSVDGHSIINARTSTEQGLKLGGVTIFTFNSDGQFNNRIEANTATLEVGHWRLEQARVIAHGVAPKEQDTVLLKTNLTREQVRESFATPESVPFWELPSYIKIAENAGLGASQYRLQYQKLITQPVLLVAMVLLASAVSLRFFRFGGVQKMVLGGVGAGFLVYVLSKVTEDLSKVGLLNAVAAAWFPVVVGGLTGLVVLLYQEDG